MPGTLWKNKDFIWLISGQTISKFGSAISGFAIPWLLLEITGSVMQMGLVYALGFIPYILLSLPAGVWADRYNRKNLMMIANIAQMCFILSIPLVQFLFGNVEVLQLYVVRAGMSAFSALFDSAYGACLPNVVERGQLKQANSIMQTGVATSQIVGPSLAGILVSIIGAANTVFLDGITYFFSVISLLMIRKSFSANPLFEEKQKPESMLSEIMEGLQYIWKQQLIRTISILTLLSNVANSAIAVVILYRLQFELHLSSSWAGFVMTGFSLGAILASVISVSFAKKIKMKTIMILTLTVQLIPPIMIAWTKNPVLITAGTIVMGAAGVLWNIHSVTLRQSIIPNHLLGRTSSSIRMTVWASIPFGSAGGGALAQAFGASFVFLLAGGIRAINLLLAIRSPLITLDSSNFNDDTETGNSKAATLS